MSQEPGSQLPSPYISPWQLLRRDLRALVASLRLRFQELWRRNGQGDLPLPGFWPSSAGALFWPLALALGLALLIALPSTVLQIRAAHPPRAVVVSPFELVPTPLPTSMSPSTGKEETPSPPEPEPLAPQLELDPLLELLSSDDPAQRLISARPFPEQSRLLLVVSEGFSAENPAEQSRLAQAWLERSEALGYEQLELQDPQGRCLGRQARIGSGMILLQQNLGS